MGSGPHLLVSTVVETHVSRLPKSLLAYAGSSLDKRGEIP